MIPHYIIQDVLEDNLGKNIKLHVSSRNGGYDISRRSIHIPSLIELKMHSLDQEQGILAIRGIAKRKLRRGDVILPIDWDGAFDSIGYFYSPKRDFITKEDQLTKTPLSIKVRNGDVKIRQNDHLVEVKFKKSQYLIPGGDYEFKGIKGPLVLICRGTIAKGQKSFFQQATADWKGSTDLYKQALALRLAIYKSCILPVEKNHVKLPDTLMKSGQIIQKDFWSKKLKELERSVSAMGGQSLEELSKKFSSLLHPLKEELLSQKKLRLYKGYLMVNHKEPEKNISPFAKALLQRFEEQELGISPSSLNPSELELSQAMERMGLLKISEDMLCHLTQYRKGKELIKSILMDQPPRDISWIKEHSSLSRRLLLNYLIWMEEEGEIINTDNYRSLPGN